MKGFDQRAQIINELLQGLESAKQLKNHILLNRTSNTSSTSRDAQEALNYSLLDKMLSSFDKTINIAKQINLPGAHQHYPTNNPNTCFQFESPHSLVTTLTSSPRSENYDPELRTSKRRKTMPRWTKTVRVSSDKSVSGLEGPLEDGFSWRKYGQKDILGAKFPRGYYRCTHRHSKGCTATKQVQRSDEDPTLHQMIYRGEHTCSSRAQQDQPQINSLAQIKTEPQLPPSPQQPHPICQPIHQEVFVGLGPEGDLRVESEEAQNMAQLFRSYSFTSAWLQAEPCDENYMLSCSPAFGSPTTSDSNHFPASSSEITNILVVPNIQTSESDMTDPLYGPDSVNNSPKMDDFEFPYDQLLDIDPNFAFEF